MNHTEYGKTYEPLPDETRVCSRCGEEKPLTEYRRNRNKPQGVGSACKECMSWNGRQAREKTEIIGGWQSWL